MNDTQINEHDDAEVAENEILDVTIIDEDAEADEPVAESAFDRPGRWYIVHTFAGHEKKVIGALNNIISAYQALTNFADSSTSASSQSSTIL